ncbi:hypothetical protein SCHPADRAFT_927374 [Schizopora paradoxa]|uniref:F-box domain-containing protein n=1 Tax=Schizopora paradoxa TaxID=27342 RepID=A0A0H2S033_9AGAM|nr:hypothetical protein SCHPADRAFT_927374 [Schizopora paradoxa]
MGGIPVEDSETGLHQLFAALEIWKESEFKQQDARAIWCPEWASASEDSDILTETKVQIAKRALKRLKSIKKALATATELLDKTFERVTEQSSDIIRIAGFSSLPDDVLARIFEMNHHAYMDAAECGGVNKERQFVCSSNILAQVCRRFRRIALHIPSLWEVVSNSHGKGWISTVKERCRSPSIFIAYDFPKAGKSIPELVEHTLPAMRWKGLNIHLMKRKDGHDAINHISTISDGNFPSLESLSLQLDWEYNKAQTNDDDVDDMDFSINLSNSASSLLSDWCLPKLSRLRLKNLFPYTIDCPNVRTCHIELTQLFGTNRWDLEGFEGFLECMPLIESLSLSFLNAWSLTRHDFAGTEPIKFLHLKSLEISVQGNTSEKFLRSIMNMMDFTAISDLTVSLCPICPDETMDSGKKVEEWLGVIFFLDSSSGFGTRKRVFPDVEVFRLDLQEDGDHFSYRDIFGALPRIRDLTLELPGCGEPDIPTRDMKGLRSLHLLKSGFYYSGETLKFLKEQNELGKIEKVGIEGCSNLVRYKDDLKDLLGDKFVWKG